MFTHLLVKVLFEILLQIQMSPNYQLPKANVKVFKLNCQHATKKIIFKSMTLLCLGYLDKNAYIQNI